MSTCTLFGLRKLGYACFCSGSRISAKAGRRRGEGGAGDLGLPADELRGGGECADNFFSCVAVHTRSRVFLFSCVHAFRIQSNSCIFVCSFC